MAKTLSRRQSVLATGVIAVIVRYLRVSKMGDRKLNDPAFHSPELQIAAINAKCDEVYGVGGWRLADIEGDYGQATWGDFGVSGRSMKRAGLDKAIGAILAYEGNVEGLAVLNLSRWGRTVLGALTRMEELEQMGTGLISAKEKSDKLETASGRFEFNLWLSLGQFYSDQKAEDWAELIQKRAEEGSHHGKPPTGFRRPRLILPEVEGAPADVEDDDPDDRTPKTRGDIEPDEAAADIVLAFEQIANGATRRSVWLMLRDRGHLTSSTDLWKLLHNRAYLQWHAPECVGTVCEREVPHGDRGSVRAYDLKPVGEGKKQRVGETWYPGRHVGIIEPGLWARAQAKLDAMERGTRQRLAHHELAGCVRCAGCKRVLSTMKPGKSWPNGSKLMRDSSGKEWGCPGCGTVTADLLLGLVLDEMRAMVESAGDDAIKAGRARTPKPPKPKSRATLIKRRDLALAQSVEIQAQMRLGSYDGTEEEGKALVARMKAEVQRIDAELAVPKELPMQARIDGIHRARALLDTWENIDVAARNEGMRGLVTIFVSRRPEGAPSSRWLPAGAPHPYAERSSIVWAWEIPASQTSQAQTIALPAAARSSGVDVALTPDPTAVPIG